jgi:hypothetical protein
MASGTVIKEMMPACVPLVHSLQAYSADSPRRTARHWARVSDVPVCDLGQITAGMLAAMILPLECLSLRQILMILPVNGERSDEVESLVLRHRVVLLRQVSRPTLEPAVRAALEALSQLLPRSMRSMFFVTSATRLHRHRNVVTARRRFSMHQRGLLAVRSEIRVLLPRPARDKPPWGRRRIPGELVGSCCRAAARAVQTILT